MGLYSGALIIRRLSVNEIGGGGGEDLGRSYSHRGAIIGILQYLTAPTCNVPQGASEPAGPFLDNDYAPLIKTSKDPTENEERR